MAGEWIPMGAGLSMGLGAIGSGIGIGMLANGALQSLGGILKQEVQYNKI